MLCVRPDHLLVVVYVLSVDQFPSCGRTIFWPDEPPYWSIRSWLCVGISVRPSVWFTSPPFHPIVLKSDENNVCVPLCDPVVVIDAPQSVDDKLNVLASITVIK